MRLLKKILHKLDGLHFSQEYLCLALEPFSRPLHAYLVNDEQVIKDITNEHLFVGYCPLIFAFANTGPAATIDMIFSQQVVQPNGRLAKKDALGVLQLKKVKQQQAGNDAISYYEGSNGKHHFQPAFHQLIGSINNRLYNKKAGNVFLHDNLYKQVQLAYAVPRIISLITVGDGGLFNLFPTDLHGQAGTEHYIISLRTGGKAAAQVAAAGQLVISQLPAEAYKTVYALGKNHMQELKHRDNFPFDGLSSPVLHLPLPKAIFSYRELKLLDSFTHGIHTLFLFSILTRHQIKPATTTLAHIHNSYASWRHKNKLPGNYLLR